MPKYFLAILALVSSSSLLEKKATAGNCIVSSYKNLKLALQKCKNLVIKDLVVPAKLCLEINLLPGALLQFKGTIKWSYAEWNGPLMIIKGEKVRVIGSGAVLDGRGIKWWDGNGDNGKVKPKLLRIMTTGGSVLKNIKILNCPHQCVSVNTASDTTLDGFEIDSSAGDAAGGKNTDGFDVSNSRGIIVKNSIVKNQDDCVAVNQGSNMIFSNLTCIGGHGLSLSVGQTSTSGFVNIVKNVTFSGSSVINSDNGIHVKTHSDAGTGLISDVKFTNIKLFGIRKYGINVEEDYEKGKPTGNAKGNIPIKKLIMKKIAGNMAENSDGMAVYILCGKGGCSNWSWTEITIKKSSKPNKCNFTANGYKC